MYELQSPAVCRSVLQCVAACCSVLQCVAVCCSVLQCVAVCCRVLQCVAVFLHRLIQIHPCQGIYLLSLPHTPVDSLSLSFTHTHTRSLSLLPSHFFFSPLSSLPPSHSRSVSFLLFSSVNPAFAGMLGYSSEQVCCCSVLQCVAVCCSLL